MGATIPMVFDWQTSEQNKTSMRRLTRQKTEDTHLLLTEPPSQINVKNNQVETFDTQLNQVQLSKLIDAPAIAEKDLEVFNLHMIKNKLDSYLPLPLDTKVIDQKAELVRPKAVISQFSNPLDEHRCTPCLKLSWLYGDTEIQCLDDETIVMSQSQAVIRIQRNTENEQSLLQPLVDLQFNMQLLDSETEIEQNQLLAVINNQLSAIDALNCWHQFLEIDRFDLEDQGWVIELAPDFQMEFVHPMDDWDVEIEQENDWFSLRFDIALDESGDHKVPLLPIVSNLLKQYDVAALPAEIMVEHKAGQFLILPREKIQPIIELVYELFDSVPMLDESIKLSSFDALAINQLDTNTSLNIRWSGDLRIKELGAKLANFDGIQTVMPAKAFKGTLRDYQIQGLSWLQFLREYGFSGILADDMGLGKTVQTLAHLQKEKLARRLVSPCLIVAPTSLMSNWKKEAARFAPNLKVHVSQGAQRGDGFDSLAKFDIILTTYPLIKRDFEVLSKLSYYMLILDEAQNIKNPKSKTATAIKALQAGHKLALTGTPMENHLGELWSIFDFLMPGFLSSEKVFKSKYRKPIETDNDQSVAKHLNRRISPFLLRRTKQIVASELPARTEIIKTVAFEAPQSLLYESIRLSMEKKVQQAIASKGLNRSHITILEALLKLRQVCCDPQLVKLSQARKVKQSAKMDLLMLMLPEMIAEGRRVLIFSQFTSMLSIIENALKAHKMRYTKLTGSTRKRDEVIEKFTSGRADIFLISLKAGGVGLNLTAADTVIHYDPWWNPAVENQASDRAHRIGQDKPVFIYKLVVENTLEEKILEMQTKKQTLADGIYGDNHAKDASALTASDLKALFQST